LLLLLLLLLQLFASVVAVWLAPELTASCLV
jgi:hypothetical protein